MKLLLFLTLPLFLTSCQLQVGPGTTPGQTTTAESALQDAGKIAALAVLNKATSPEDIEKKKAVLNDVASAVVLLVDQGTTGEDVAAAILSRTPKDADGETKLHWLGFSLAAKYAWNQARSQYVGSVPYGSLLTALARGIQTSTAL